MNKRVVIVGGGYSLKEGIDKGLWKRIGHEEVWSINYAFRRMPYAPSAQLWLDMEFFLDNFYDLKKLHESGTELVTGVYRKNLFYKYFNDILTEVTKKRNDYVDAIKFAKAVRNDHFLKLVKTICQTNNFGYFLYSFLDIKRSPFRLIADDRNSRYFLICSKRNKTKSGKITFGSKKMYVLGKDYGRDLESLLNPRVKDIVRNILNNDLIKDIVVYETTRSVDRLHKRKKLFSKFLSGIFALSLAYFRKYDTVFLLGYDFGAPCEGGGLKEYYKKKLKGYHVAGENYHNLIRFFDKKGNLKKAELEEFKIFKKLNMNIYNVSKTSNIPYFRKISYESFLNLLC